MSDPAVKAAKKAIVEKLRNGNYQSIISWFMDVSESNYASVLGRFGVSMYNASIEWEENGINYKIESLAALNDTPGFTSAQLADVIEYFY